jgi:hypothetical protein
MDNVMLRQNSTAGTHPQTPDGPQSAVEGVEMVETGSPER